MISPEGRPIVSAAKMRAAEDRAIAGGASVASLMARAGEAIAAAVDRLGGQGADVLVLCGPGNNGGDGYVAASALVARGRRVRVAAAAEPASPAAIDARRRWPGPVEALADAASADILVDALFGTGLSRPLDEAVAAALTRLSHAADLVVAVDLPSGVATDDGTVLSDAPPASLTLALGAAKPAHLLQPAAARCGTVRVIDIGVAVESDVAVLAPTGYDPPGPADHKFTRGMVAIVGGAMPGAAALAASAAARVAGYVLLLGSATDRLPHAIVRRRWSAEPLADERIGAVVIGPGLGRDEAARGKLDAALASDRALVIDGDALHLLNPGRLRDRGAPAILTPHAGEFAHLFGQGSGSRIDRALSAARACGATVVLKGPDTVVAHPDGRARVAAEHVGWLATAGSGDVLAGITGGLLAHSHEPFAAATDAVWFHTDAARRAGPAFVADDLVGALPAAIGARR